VLDISSLQYARYAEDESQDALGLSLKFCCCKPTQSYHMVQRLNLMQHNIKIPDKKISRSQISKNY